MATIYQPFTDGGSQIRIVTIQPGRQDDPVSCTLETYTFAHAPRYEALSYCWGEEENLQPIRLQGVDWNVTPNLYRALKGLRKEKGLRVMWIDAVCINQEDKQEKSVQVPLMGFIYKNARQVIAWLGDENEHTQEVFALIEDLPAMLSSEDTDTPLTEECVRKWQGIWDSVELWEATLDLFERPYWSRLWVLQEYVSSACRPRARAFQVGFSNWHGTLAVYPLVNFRDLPFEVLFTCFDFHPEPLSSTLQPDRRSLLTSVYKFRFVLSRKTVIRCGRRVLQPQSIIPFSMAMARLQDFVIDNHVLEWISDPMAKTTIRLEEMSFFPLLASFTSRGFFAVTTKPPRRTYSIRDLTQDSTSFFRLFISTSALQCKDPRDKIYAILGLTALHWREKHLSVLPDYNKALSDVYREFTLSYIKFTKSFRILEKAGLQRCSRSDLPSWVPDLTFDDTLTPPQYYYPSNACGSLQVTFECNTSSGLIVRALLCDVISSEITSQNEESSSSPAITTRSQEYFEALFAFVTKQERNTFHRHGITPVRSIWDILFCLLVTDADGIDASKSAILVPGFCHLFGTYRLSYLGGSAALPPAFNNRSFLDWYYVLARGLQDFEIATKEDKWMLLRQDLPFQTLELSFPLESGTGTDRETEVHTFTSWAQFRYAGPTKIFRTRNGFFGTTGDKAEIGDTICILAGANNPFVLRKVSGSYQIVDYCYVPGMMHGEMVKLHEKGILQLEDIEIT